jgi:hypothetical protein
MEILGFQICDSWTNTVLELTAVGAFGSTFEACVLFRLGSTLDR